MPTLPTIEVTQTQADRMLAAYGSVENYKKWLKNQIVLFVTDKELNENRAAMEAQLLAEHEANKASLGYEPE